MWELFPVETEGLGKHAANIPLDVTCSVGAGHVEAYI